MPTGIRASSTAGHDEALHVERADVAQPEGDVGEQVQRGAAGQGDGGDCDFSGSPVCSSVFFSPSATSTMPATIGKCR